MILRHQDIDSALHARARQRALIEGRGPRVNEFLLNPHRFGGGGGSGDPYWSDVVSLLHFEGANGSTTFTDVKGKTWGRFGTDAPVISTTQAKFGSSSMLVNPASAVRSSGMETGPSSDFDFGTGDFTIEWWQRWTSLSTPLYQCAFQRGYGVAGGITLVTGNSDGLYGFYIGAPLVLVCSESTPPTTGVWVHYALTRSGNDFTIWRGGAASATGSNSSSISAAGKNFAVGSYASDSGALGQLFNGYFDDFRVTKGVARYTSTFTPPTASFPDF